MKDKYKNIRELIPQCDFFIEEFDNFYAKNMEDIVSVLRGLHVPIETYKYFLIDCKNEILDLNKVSTINIDDLLEKIDKSYESSDKIINDLLVFKLPNGDKGIADKDIIDCFDNAITMMLSPQYCPAHDHKDINNHLVALYTHYQNSIGKTEYIIADILAEYALNISLRKLLIEADRLITGLVYYVSEMVGRIGLANLKIKRKKEQLGAEVEKCFYDSGFHIKGKTFNAIARDITTRLKEKDILPKPKAGEKDKDYTKTIKRRMFENERIKNDLIALGVFKDKCNV